LLKDKPLGSDRCSCGGRQVQGLTHLVTLALRVLTLFEVLVAPARSRAARSARVVSRQAKRTTDRPDGDAGLEAIARARITLSQVESGRIVAGI